MEFNFRVYISHTWWTFIGCRGRSSLGTNKKGNTKRSRSIENEITAAAQRRSSTWSTHVLRCAGESPTRLSHRPLSIRLRVIEQPRSVSSCTTRGETFDNSRAGEIAAAASNWKSGGSDGPKIGRERSICEEKRSAKRKGQLDRATKDERSRLRSFSLGRVYLFDR